MPLQLLFFPNSIPTQYTFDYTWVKFIEDIEKKQKKAYEKLGEELRKYLRKKGMKEEDFTDDNEHRYMNGFQKNLKLIDAEFNFNAFNSDQLLQLADFLGMKAISGTFILTRLYQIIVKVPSYLANMALWACRSKRRIDISGNKFLNYQIVLNFQPFEFLKKQLLLAQIHTHLRSIKNQDQALLKLGMKDIKGKEITNFARERGITSIACYESLKAFLQNMWIKKTLDYSNNQMVWHAIMLYDVLEHANMDPPVSIKPQAPIINIKEMAKQVKEEVIKKRDEINEARQKQAAAATAAAPAKEGEKVSAPKPKAKDSDQAATKQTITQQPSAAKADSKPGMEAKATEKGKA